ncbi:hypothetical protein [Zunongwangia pacifica]|uniref:Endosialidase-like protein n=1 Tax=Zunongwangia pacifica TaxID=2911062 RepID=A0A9X2CQY8_9FLAO|nr:hypothetical protein [Zunongwangia pacifica]MCL6220593.1 hypothetical protein [Zunongwangia pacifica]
MNYKTIFLLVFLGFSFNIANAQFTDYGTFSATSDSISIGGGRPKYRLHVAGGAKIGNSYFNTVPGTSGNSWLRDTWLTSLRNLTWDEENLVWRRDNYAYNGFGGILWDDGGTYFIRQRSGTKLEYTNQEFFETAFLFANISTGYVGIGTIKPDARLSVNGEVHANEVKVDTKQWADHVFRKPYKLPELKDVEQFINEHGHLIDIPTEKEAIEEGVELGEMVRLLLQKVEELTLYTIEQQKQIDRLTSGKTKSYE